MVHTAGYLGEYGLSRSSCHYNYEHEKSLHITLYSVNSGYH